MIERCNVLPGFGATAQDIPIAIYAIVKFCFRVICMLVIVKFLFLSTVIIQKVLRIVSKKNLKKRYCDSKRDKCIDL